MACNGKRKFNVVTVKEVGEKSSMPAAARRSV